MPVLGRHCTCAILVLMETCTLIGYLDQLGCRAIVALEALLPAILEVKSFTVMQSLQGFYRLEDILLINVAP